MKAIDRKRILSSLDAPLHLHTKRKTGSTNDDLKAAARKGAPDFSLLIADRQTAGRGREGNHFFSESGLFMSLLLPCSEIASPFVTHVAAIAVAKAITELTKEKAEVKWVNDVFVKGRKVSGILTENISCETGRRIVVGIGVNLGAPKKGFPAEIADSAGYLVADRTELAILILKGLIERIASFDKSAVQKEYETLSFLTGKRVAVVKAGEIKEALVRGLSDDLGLEVTYDDGAQEVLISGEIRLKLLQNDRF